MHMYIDKGTGALSPRTSKYFDEQLSHDLLLDDVTVLLYREDEWII